MKLRQSLRTVLCCGVLQFGALLGMPMRPEQVQDLMRSLNQAKVARTAPADANHSGNLPPSART